MNGAFCKGIMALCLQGFPLTPRVLPNLLLLTFMVNRKKGVTQTRISEIRILEYED